MKLKYTGLYAPDSTWEESFYHLGTLLIKNGVVETDDDIAIDALQHRGFIPFEKWVDEEVERTREETERNAEINKQALDLAAEVLRNRDNRLSQVFEEDKVEDEPVVVATVDDTNTQPDQPVEADAPENHEFAGKEVNGKRKADAVNTTNVVDTAVATEDVDPELDKNRDGVVDEQDGDGNA